MSRLSGARMRALPLSPRPGLAPSLAAGLLWLAAGLSAGYWVLLAWGRSPVTPLTTLAPPAVVSDAGAVARALGAAPVVAVADAPAPVALSSRYRLLGVVDQPGRAGAALIAVGDQPPRPYAVGAALDGGLVLLSVDRRVARLGTRLGGPTTVELQLPSPSSGN